MMSGFKSKPPYLTNVYNPARAFKGDKCDLCINYQLLNYICALCSHAISHWMYVNATFACFYVLLKLSILTATVTPR